MSTTLIVNNSPFNYPVSGDPPGWGPDATGWAVEVTEVLNNILGPNDILETAFTVANNQSVAADVTGLAFNAGTTRGAAIPYSIYRISTINPSGNAEYGVMHLIYDNNVGWALGIGGVVGNSGVNFSITPAGQIQYTSTDIDSLSYFGELRFSAKALSQ